MKGKYNVLVQNNRLRYEFTISRNITVIRGDSATGKTTLIELLAAYDRDGESSGILVKSDVACVVIAGKRWQENLQSIHNSIVFIDECNQFVKSEAFAVSVKESDNYFVIVTREDLPNLPYSVKEIYGIRKSNKYAGLKQVYNELYQFYGATNVMNTASDYIVVVEDSNSGFDFFSNICGKKALCISANGKSNIFKLLQKYRHDKILVIADGAAFGCEMERVMQLIRSGRTVALYLPESFEWIVLSSGIFDDAEIKNSLSNPSEYVDSKRFLSWERFFTNLLMEKSSGTYLQYNKRSLNRAYLQEKNKNKIIEVMKPFEF